MAKTSAYEPDLHPQICKWMARAGLTNEQIADELGISTTTLRRWEKQHEALRSALKSSRLLVDSEVEDALLKRAKGYKTTTVSTKYISPVVNKDGDIAYDEQGQPITQVHKTINETELAPDTTACIFWLKNRMPEEWRDLKSIEAKYQLENKTTGELVAETEAYLARIAELEAQDSAEQRGAETPRELGAAEMDPETSSSS